MARGTVSKKNYLTCSRGKWRERVDSGTHGATQRTITPLDGSAQYDVWEKVDDFVSGVIREIHLVDDEKYGRQWNIIIQDGTEVLVLQFQYDSGYAMALLTKFPNADVTKEIAFHPYFFEEEKKARMVIKQNGVSIDSHFTREDPKGFPPFPDNAPGSDRADKDDVKLWKINAMKFLVRHLKENILPKLPTKEQAEAMQVEADLLKGAVNHDKPDENQASHGQDNQAPPPDLSDKPDPFAEDDDLPF